MVHEIAIGPRILLTIIAEEVQSSRSTYRSTLARRCAQEAISRLSSSDPVATPPPDIGRGPLGEPIFPPPYRGSLAHTTGWSCALVTDVGRIKGVGIDIEPVNRMFNARIVRRISSPQEYQEFNSWQHNTNIAPEWRSGLGLFCAKEATLKVLSPLLQQKLVITSVSLTVDPVSGQFQISAPSLVKESLCGAVFSWGEVLLAYALVQ